VARPRYTSEGPVRPANSDKLANAATPPTALALGANFLTLSLPVWSRSRRAGRAVRRRLIPYKPLFDVSQPQIVIVLSEATCWPAAGRPLAEGRRQLDHPSTDEPLGYIQPPVGVRR
jgi:hypothetical protein